MSKSILFVGLTGLALLGMLLVIVPTGKSAIAFTETTTAGTLITVSGTTNYINNFSQAVYAKDCTTVKTLDTRTVTTKDANYDNFQYALRPGDWKGFNRSNFTIYVSPWTSMTSANIVVEVYLWNKSTAVLRNISITGAGTYYILNNGEVAVASTRSKVTTHAGGVGKTFTYKINQSRWGVVWHPGERSYVFKWAGISLSTNATFFSESLYFDYNATYGSFNRHVFAVSGAKTKLTFINCSVVANDWETDLGSMSKYMVSGSLNYFNATKTYFKTYCPNKFSLTTSSYLNFEDVIADGMTVYQANVSLNNVLFNNFKDYMYNVYMRYSNDVTFSTGTYAVVIYGATPVVLRNSTFKQLSLGFFGAVSPTSANNYVINCNSDLWTYGGGLWATGGKMHRAYTFDLRVENATSRANLSGVSWKVYNKTGTLVASGTTGSNGCIAQQTIDHTWWNGSHLIGSYGNPCTPHRLNLTKAGYRSTEITFIMDRATNFTLGMKPNASCGSTALALYENIGNAFGTHQSQYNALTGWKVWANYTSTLLNRENLNAYLTGTHQSRWNATTGTWMSWANYSGADLLSRATIVNATGTHEYRYNASTNHWMSWANYTGLNGLNLFENIVDATGTHESQWTGTDWNVWANYTGTGGGGGTPDLMVEDNNPANTFIDRVYDNGTNLIQQSPLGQETSIAVTWKNFTDLSLFGFNLYEYCINPNTVVELVPEGYYKAQTFTVGTVGTNERIFLSNISIFAYADYQGTTGKIQVLLTRANATGCPYSPWSGVTEVSYGELDASTITTDPGGDWYNVSMENAVLQPSTTYVILFKNNTNLPVNIGEYIIAKSGGGKGLYAGGEYFTYFVGDWYGDPYADLAFKVWGYDYLCWENVLNVTFSSNESGSWGEYDTKYAFENQTVWSRNWSMDLNDTNYWWNTSIKSNHTFLQNNSFFFLTGNLTRPEPLFLYENIVNATGTHDYQETIFGWRVWANYTGNLTALHLNENIVNATGSHDYLQNDSGWWVWANYTGNTTPIHRFENIGYAFGTHDYTLNATGYWDWANYTSILLNRENLNAYLSGTHQYRWNATTGTWMSWANYSGADLLSRENIDNVTGTHDSRYNASTNHWMSWANYTGNLTSLHLLENIINATGTHIYIQNGTGYWVWANYTGNASVCNSTNLTLIKNLFNVSGFVNSSYNSTTGWTVWVNLSGNLTAIHISDTEYNVTGSVTYSQNSTGYWVNSTHESITSLFENIVGAVGTHQKQWDGSQWKVWANYTGTGASSINLYENILNATGTHEWNIVGSAYNVWANYTGNLTPLHIEENIVNASGSTDYKQNATGWWIWSNYTGNTTPIALYENFLNATGTHIYKLNSTGYHVWANVTGNVSSVFNATRIIPIGGGNAMLQVALPLSSVALCGGLLGLRRRRNRIY
jgi:hypothetical protein